MKKTVNVNLAGMFFHIDEDAFGKLTRYLDAIKRSLSDPQGSDEIIRDIEARISELFSEKMKSSSQVISLKELDEVIAVMGQPEDYMVDEEIFEDSSSNSKRRSSSSSSSSSSKKLFRDVDDKFVAGVSSGIGHYLGIDVIWIRLVWVILVLVGFGSPLLVYLLLWILVPAAESTADKLRMTGEPINISNIEKKFKEGYDAVADKVKGADYDKYGQKVKSGASGFFDTLGSILLVLVKIFVKFVGVLLVIISLSTLIGLIVGLFTFGSIDFWGHGELMDYISLIDTTNSPIWLISILALFAAGIPFFVLFILGLKLLIDNLKSIGTPAKILLLAAWILSIVGLGILGIQQATEQAFDGDSISENTLQVKTGDTLKIAMRADKQYSYDVSRQGGLKIEYDDNAEKVIYSNDIRLIVRHTRDSVGSLTIKKKAQGNSFLDAKKKAEAINYNYSLDDNNLFLNGFFTTDMKNKYRDQEVELVLYLPVGSVLFADRNTYSFHRNSSRYDDILNNGDEEYFLRIIENGTQCLDCREESDGMMNSNTNDAAAWETDVEKDFNDHQDDSHRIIIDEDGIEVKHNNNDEVLEIKHGN
ncbi:MAG: phage shock protein PspC (stress-responsive transcriptional regulator) [Flavobacteriaceae bacterium]|jgi:phage shock protein PspC (stress-responsive transcriptional regulator)